MVRTRQTPATPNLRHPKLPPRTPRLPPRTPRLPPRTPRLPPRTPRLPPRTPRRPPRTLAPPSSRSVCGAQDRAGRRLPLQGRDLQHHQVAADRVHVLFRLHHPRIANHRHRPRSGGALVLGLHSSLPAPCPRASSPHPTSRFLSPR